MDDLRDDVGSTFPYLNRFQKYLPKLVSGSLKSKAAATTASLVCSDMESLIVREKNPSENLNAYYMRCVPKENARNYFSPIKLTAAERVIGQTSLIGEGPVTETLRSPIYKMRDPDICSYETERLQSGLPGDVSHLEEKP